MLRTKCGGMYITVTWFSSKPVSFGWMTVTSAGVNCSGRNSPATFSTVLPMRCGASRFGGALQPPEVFT